MAKIKANEFEITCDSFGLYMLDNALAMFLRSTAIENFGPENQKAAKDLQDIIHQMHQQAILLR